MGKTKNSAKTSTPYLIKRYVWLVNTISKRNGITYEEIFEKWQKSALNDNQTDFPLKTFHNHRKAVEELFGIEIICDKKGGYKYYIENQEIEKKSLEEWLFNTFSVINLLNEAENLQLENRILLEEAPSGKVFLSPITEAIKGNFQLKISYKKFWEDTENQVIIYPYLLKYFKQRWYVVGYKPSVEALRVYALDRIKSTEVLTEKFSLPNDFNGEDYFHHNFGIILDEDVDIQDIVIKTHPNKTNYLKSLPLHHSQKFVKTEGDFSFFEYHLRPTFDFRQEILSHGDEMEVVSPESFRQEIKEMIQKMQQLYK